MNHFMDAYKPDINSKLFNVLGTDDGYKGLPPTFFQICGLDPLRDEAMIYERKLREENGVTTKSQIYPGVPHGYWAMFPEWEKSKKFVNDTVKGIEWILSQNRLDQLEY